MFKKVIELYNHVFGLADYLQSAALLAARLYVAWVFFKAGLTKLRDWDSTLLLFEYEYSVPLLSFDVAAYLATFVEIVLPVMLVLGAFGRKAAAGLFVLNYVAMISLEDMPQAAYNLHVIWGLLCALIAIWGCGKVSLDRWLRIH